MAGLKIGKSNFVADLLLAFAASAVAQQSGGPKPGSSGVTLEVTTKLTLEDVTVTDAKGKPVHGLTQADFTVKEDGRPAAHQEFPGIWDGQASSPGSPTGSLPSAAGYLYQRTASRPCHRRAEFPAAGLSEYGAAASRCCATTGAEILEGPAAGHASRDSSVGGRRSVALCRALRPTAPSWLPQWARWCRTLQVRFAHETSGRCATF